MSCLMGEPQQNLDGERQHLVSETSEDFGSLTGQLRDAKLLAVLNATNDRLIDHDDTNDSIEVRMVQPQVSGEIPEQLLRSAIQIKDI